MTTPAGIWRKTASSRPRAVRSSSSRCSRSRSTRPRSTISRSSSPCRSRASAALASARSWAECIIWVKKAIASPTKKYVPVFARFKAEKALCGGMKNQSAAR